MATSTGRRKKNEQSILGDIPANLRAKIEEAAAWRGVPVGRFIADAAVKEAEQIIERERLIRLTREDTELVLSLLDNPPKPNAALRKAARAYKRLIRD
jgi:uncharacterized protein (DUF1778 family)